MMANKQWVVGKREVVGCLWVGVFWGALSIGCAAKTPEPEPTHSLDAGQDAFLEELGARLFRYFWEQSDPNTGLTHDRSRADGSPYGEDERARIASSAATGFGLSALCLAAERNWIGATEARERARATLRFFANDAFHEHGWFYHWMDAKTGERRWRSEISSIDTALLLAGVLTVRQCFDEDPEIRDLATKIYERVDFQWMLNGDPLLLSHGWKPETGFLKYRWDTYSEDTILYILAIGSPTHSISPESWSAIDRQPVDYKQYHFYGRAPLFTHQYSQAWIDYRGRTDKIAPHMNYFDNSVTATRAQRAFCIDLADEFPSYSENIWGITASDSAKGYLAWGGPPRHPETDGTVVPCAPGGSLMFTPDISIPALQTMKERFGDKIYKRYGFVDAFNPASGWIDKDVIGIDVGIMLLSSETLRGEKIWNWFMANPEIPRALELVGLGKNSR